MTKKYIVTVYTDCMGEENSFRIESQNYSEVEEYAYDAAKDNFESFGGVERVAENMGYYVDSMSEENWAEVFEEIESNEPFGASIVEYNEKLHGDWDDYDNLA